MPGPLSYYRGKTRADAIPRIPAKHHVQLIEDAQKQARENREAIARRVISRRQRLSIYLGNLDAN